MDVREKLSLNIDKNTLVSINAPLNYNGNVEIDVTPWMTPISVKRFDNDGKQRRNEKDGNKKFTGSLRKVFGQTKTAKLVVSVLLFPNYNYEIRLQQKYND